MLHSSSRWAVEEAVNHCSASVKRHSRSREPGLFPCRGAGRPAGTRHLACDETTSERMARPHEQRHVLSIEESHSALLERARAVVFSVLWPQEAWYWSHIYGAALFPVRTLPQGSSG